MRMLPNSDCSLLVRTDFTSDKAWQQVSAEAQAQYADGQAYLEPVSDPASEGAPWQAVKAAVPAGDSGASVLFIADTTTLTLADHPVLVGVLLLPRPRRPARLPARADSRREEMAGRRMPPTGQGPGRPRRPSVPAVALLPPPHRAVHLRARAARPRRLLRLATTPMIGVACQLGYAWSRWRRKRQARACYHHYQARLRAAPA